MVPVLSKYTARLLPGYGWFSKIDVSSHDRLTERCDIP